MPGTSAFYAEKLKRERFDLSEEALRPYFPLPRVLAGMFAVAEKLYGVKIAERSGVDIYHPDVRFYDILNADGSRRGGFFVDLYARAEEARRRVDGRVRRPQAPGRRDGAAGRLPGLQLHAAGRRAAVAADALRSRDDVPRVRPRPASHADARRLSEHRGHQRRAWDAVELPSQFMENFAWRAEVIPLISAHVETASRCRRRNCSAARHAHFPGGHADGAAAGVRAVRSAHPQRVRAAMRRAVMQTLAEVRAQVAVVQPPAFNRFPHSFQHIFSGGYAAGYYSYKWAEVLAADAFSAFEEHGIFDARRRATIPGLDPGTGRQSRRDGSVRRVPRPQAADRAAAEAAGARRLKVAVTGRSTEHVIDYFEPAPSSPSPRPSPPAR